MRNAARGMTLIEVLIGSIILAMVLLITFAVLMRSQSAYTEASISQDLENRCRQFIDVYKKDLEFCLIVTMAADGQSLRYQIPPTTASTGTIEWGYPTQGVHQAGWEAELAFVPELVFLEATGLPIPGSLGGVPVEVAAMDMNRDGDDNDVFARGKLVKRIYDDLGVQQDQETVSDNVILLSSGAGLNGDINADGIADALFVVLDSNGNTVTPALIGTSGIKTRVNICHGTWADSRKLFVLRQLRDEWNFRNSQ